MLKKQILSMNTKTLVYILMVLDIVVALGVGLNLVQLIAQWNTIGGIIVYTNMWNGAVVTTSSVVLFVGAIVLCSIGIILFAKDFFDEIKLVKKLSKKAKSFDNPVEND